MDVREVSRVVIYIGQVLTTGLQILLTVIFGLLAGLSARGRSWRRAKLARRPRSDGPAGREAYLAN